MRKGYMILGRCYVGLSVINNNANTVLLCYLRNIISRLIN